VFTAMTPLLANQLVAARTVQIGARYMPVVIYMALNPQKKVQEMTIATF
jgi:hypothetical protein